MPWQGALESDLDYSEEAELWRLETGSEMPPPRRALVNLDQLSRTARPGWPTQSGWRAPAHRSNQQRRRATGQTGWLSSWLESDSSSASRPVKTPAQQHSVPCTIDLDPEPLNLDDLDDDALCAALDAAEAATTMPPVPEHAATPSVAPWPSGRSRSTVARPHATSSRSEQSQRDYRADVHDASVNSATQLEDSSEAALDGMRFSSAAAPVSESDTDLDSAHDDDKEGSGAAEPTARPGPEAAPFKHQPGTAGAPARQPAREQLPHAPRTASGSVQQESDGTSESHGTVRHLPCVEVESLSSLRLGRRTVCDAALRERLEDASCRMLALPSLQSHVYASNTPWATVGILSRIEHRVTKSGQPCVM